MYLYILTHLRNTQCCALALHYLLTYDVRGVFLFMFHMPRSPRNAVEFPHHLQAASRLSTVFILFTKP